MSVHVANGPEGMPRALRESTLLVAGVAGLALLLALSGAFDTDEIGAARRTALWLIVSGLLIGQASFVDSLLRRLAPPGAVYRLLAAVGTIAVTLALMTVELHGLKLTPLPPQAWGHDALFDLAFFIAPTVAVVAGLVVLLRGSFARRANAARLEAPDEASTAARRSDWPEEPILWVRAHDHYLEVATASRTLFLRGGLRDAAARLKDAPGLQVHRSWWVARDAVAAVRREGRDLVLVLENGVHAPVGRSRVGALRARGWL